MARLHLLGSSLAGALSSAIVPISALLLFSTLDYGAFSVAYLIFGLGWSVTLSTICDTWSRSRGHVPEHHEWSAYSGALLAASLIAFLITFAVTAVALGQWGAALAAAGGVGANIFRLGARFFHAASRGPQAVLASDFAAVVLFVIAIGTILFTRLDPLLGVLSGWAVSNLGAAVLFPPPNLRRRFGLAAWVMGRRDRIVPLLGESLLMDAGAIGAPLAMAPLLGTSNFGAYRSISSVAMPIQLTLDPLRPNISQTQPALLLGRGVALGVLGVAALMALACFAVLGIVLPQMHFVAGALATLSQYALACTLYVAVGFPGHFYYIVARSVLDHQYLVRGRAVQTVMHILFPLAGLFLGKLDGAIWGFVAANAIAAFVWPAFLIHQHGRAPQPAAGKRRFW